MVLTIPIEGIAWTSYTTVEDDFIKYLDYVPCTHEHRGVWSPKLANLLLNIGSLIDSIFRSYLESPTLNSANNIDEIRNDQRKQKINGFQKVYDAVHSFSNRDVYLLSTGEKFIPWSNWQRPDTPPSWWTAYNKVKHDRFRNRTKATLENTLNALSGLLLICVLLKEFRPYLVDIGIIKGTGLYEVLVKHLLEQNEPINEEAHPIIAKSKLFGYIFRSKGHYESQGFAIISMYYPPIGTTVRP